MTASPRPNHGLHGWRGERSRFRGIRGIRGFGRFGEDERGAFLVVEAILVAVLVLTAVLFFTSVQRPTGGSESRGVDLGPVATDTLGILQRRSFTASPYGDPEGWVTAVLLGDTAEANEVDAFLGQVLPTGAKHFVRLSNGIGSVDLLPLSSPGSPQGARAAEVPFFPHWRAFADQAATDVGYPGQPLDATANALLSRFTDPADSIACIKAPYNGTATSLWRTPTQVTGTLAAGSATVTGLASTAALAAGMRVTGTNVPAGTTVDTIPGSSSVTLSNAATGSGATTLSFYANRVPPGAVYGIWAAYTAADCSGTPTAYAAVVLPGARTVPQVATALDSKEVIAASPAFSSADVGRLVVGSGIVGATTVASVTDATHAFLSANATATSNVTLTLAPDPTYPMYGLQLVVWFGA